jgi:hypothetical protein
MADQDKTSSQKPGGEERRVEGTRPKAGAQADASRDAKADQGIGTVEEAFKAATHGTDEAPHTHPAHAEHPVEHPGRHADDSWKKNRKHDEA